jgi:hypothetical protein
MSDKLLVLFNGDGSDLVVETGGKFLHGAAEVRITKEGFQVLNAHGELLASTKTEGELSRESNGYSNPDQLAKDFADFFGYDEESGE